MRRGIGKESNWAEVKEQDHESETQNAKKIDLTLIPDCSRLMAGAQHRTESGCQSAALMARREASAPSAKITGRINCQCEAAAVSRSVSIHLFGVLLSYCFSHLPL